MKKLLIPLVVMALFSCQGKKPPETLFSPVKVTPASGRKVGLALGGGSSRGFSQVGVLKVLEEEKIPVCCIAGSSSGALIGALYCDAGGLDDIERITSRFRVSELVDYNIFRLIRGRWLIKGERMERFLRQNLRHKNIEDLPIPLGVVATEMKSGDRAVFRSGSIETAVRASCAIPGLFQPVKIGDGVYIDGGMSDPVPVGLAREMGADVVIAVVIPDDLPEELPKSALKSIKYSLTVLFSKMTEHMVKDADVVIRPQCGITRFDDISRRREMILAGEKAAREAMPKIRKLLKPQDEAAEAGPAL